MKIFLAGATGAIGTRLVPLLLERGHEVTAMTRSREKARTLEELGARPAIADGLHRSAVIKAVLRAEPEVVIHEMTALASVKSLRNFDKAFALTNRLRTEGTDHLLEGARAVGARRLIAQSYAGWNYAPAGTLVKRESDPLNPKPPARQRESMAAFLRLERTVTESDDVEGVVLRYGALYGPGTSGAPDGEFAALLRKRQFPIIGDGAGVWSFVHVDDAARATMQAINHGEPGTYNIVDDVPAPVSEWLPVLAKRFGAKPPRHMPVWLGRLVAGKVVVSMMTRTRGASNAKAKAELDWHLIYPSWRDGFRNGLSDLPPDPTVTRFAA